MAASAEYELEKRVERLELFPVELEKGERPGADHVGLLSGASFCLGPLSATHSHTHSRLDPGSHHQFCVLLQLPGS